MGEYAKYQGSDIKIGTCESMYYLRADQRELIDGYDFASFLGEIRFRFPFPDEDTIAPGQFEDYDRGVRIPGDWEPPADYEHNGSVQFKAEPGYLLSIPCPEGPNVPEGLRVGKNGWHGGYEVRQQKWVDGEWWTVVGCRSCGCLWRLPREEAEKVAAGFATEAVREEWRRKYDHEADAFIDDYGFEPVHHEDGRRRLEAIAERILAGYSSVVLAAQAGEES